MNIGKIQLGMIGKLLNHFGIQKDMMLVYMAKKTLSKKQIDNLVKKIAYIAKEEKVPISRAFVFGSYAKKNKANKKSDLDLCFISSSFKNTIEAEAYLRTKIYFETLKSKGLISDIPVDVVVYRPKNFKEFSPLLYEIKKRGREIKIN